MANNIQYIRGDLMDYIDKNYYIAHQCNCITNSASGLAKIIFDKIPEANIYNDGTIREPGKVIIRKNIINMLAQYNAGGPNKYNTAIQREMLFKNCLKEIIKIFPQGCNIAFPAYIGCGLAGGNWKNYNQMLINFSQENKNFNILIVEKK